MTIKRRSQTSNSKLLTIALTKMSSSKNKRKNLAYSAILMKKLKSNFDSLRGVSLSEMRHKKIKIRQRLKNLMTKKKRRIKRDN